MFRRLFQMSFMQPVSVLPILLAILGGWGGVAAAVAAETVAAVAAIPVEVASTGQPDRKDEAAVAVDAIGSAAGLLAAGRAAEAYAALASLEAQRGGDPEFDYLLALAALESGQPTQALAPLRRVLAVEPRFDGARLELARALSARGDADGARREYQWVIAHSASATAREAATRALAGVPPGRSWRFAPVLLAGAGYDSNANASTAGEVFGFVLDPQAVQQGSPLIEVGASLAGERALPGRDGRAAVLLRGGHRAYPDASFVDQSMIDIGAGINARFGDWRAGVGLTLATGWLDGTAWFNSAWVEGALSRPIGQRWELAVAGRALALDYRQSRFELLDARRYLWGAVLQSRERAGEMSRYGVGVLGGRDDARAASSPWSNDRYGLRAFGAWPLAPRRALFGELAWLATDYFGGRGFAGLDRLDHQVTAAMGLELRAWPAPGWRITPQLRWTDSDSNVAPFRFDRFEAVVFVQRHFD
ncbi:MAG: tetratricopeptide repeat protein [Sinobacteraceae bacterium]|nr:tetratricopeptide repeat protein [Nevskiaceae bacterium]